MTSWGRWSKSTSKVFQDDVLAFFAPIQLHPHTSLSIRSWAMADDIKTNEPSFDRDHQPLHYHRVLVPVAEEFLPPGKKVQEKVQMTKWPIQTSGPRAMYFHIWGNFDKYRRVNSLYVTMMGLLLGWTKERQSIVSTTQTGVNDGDIILRQYMRHGRQKSV